MNFRLFLVRKVAFSLHSATTLSDIKMSTQTDSSQLKYYWSSYSSDRSNANCKLIFE